MEEPEIEKTLKEKLLPCKDDELPIDVSLRHCTQGLFYEFRHKTKRTDSPYCLKSYDYEFGGSTYRSMYMIYMECDSEYEAGIKLLGSYTHWCRLKETSWFKPYFERWEEERNIRDEAISRSILIKLCQEGNVTAAAKIFANSKNKTKVGRPSKQGKRTPAPTLESLDSMLDRLEEEE